jgi:GNAT superfamily N-acetyltransferase
LIHKQVSPRDGRQSILHLSETGLETYRMLNSRSQKEIEAMLGELTEHDQSRLVNAMRTIQRLLDPENSTDKAYTLRPPQPGDLGWVVTQHGSLYAREYGWDESFEGFVAEIIAEYVKNYIPEKERCWIAEVDGQNAGSVFVVRKSDEVAKLRMLIVTTEARGLGIGKRLVEECINFARQAGYRKMTLWTNSCLLAARHIYEHFGFLLMDSEPYHDFGQDLVSETWELGL